MHGAQNQDPPETENCSAAVPFATRRDVASEPELPRPQVDTPPRGRERIMLAYYAAIAVAAGALLVRASAQPHEALASEEETGTAAVSATLTPGMPVSVSRPLTSPTSAPSHSTR